MLDTSAYTAFKRGRPSAVVPISQAQMILLPAVVMGELLAGFEIGSRRQQNRDELDAFWQSSRVRLVEITDQTSERYALIYAFLRRNGRPIPTNDLWIAASAMEHSARLLTADSHFLNLPQILVTFLDSPV